ncbi:hypothetical protein NPX13_g10852 [Xylaria arbuscula]|uniref:Cytochrome P450 n=1 Tax=Xylaria arbuscula TaxID=114810 RepID=A0A9W8N401_9PEZI|nr:hypothetical protein NPX13_g10852 [Xylaria arbuscula]
MLKLASLLSQILVTTSPVPKMDTASVDVTPELLKSSHVYTLGALGILALLLLFSSTQNDPLSHVPGPWYARWTDLPSKYYWVDGRKAPYIHDLHQKYGPIVRVGPREVYTADPQIAKTVFRIKNEFPKSSWYLDFVPFTVTVFNTPDIHTHRRFRRLLSSPLSESGLKEFLPQIEHKVNLAILGMAEEYKSRGAADIYKWWLFMTTDVIGELSFGESFRMLETQKAAQRIRAYSLESLQRHKAIVAREGPDSRPTVFSKVYKAEDDASITHDEIRDNAQAYIIAGSDTTSNTLTYLAWAVCRHPEIKSRLLKELEVLPDDFDYEDLRVANLSYLEHVVDEALRRFPAAPSGLPREVPKGGAELGGYHIPAGYTVTTQNYSLHRDLHAFPDPEKFDPSRWENPTPAMKDAFMPFGGGSRICIGLHLAKIELRLGAARFFKTFPNATMSSLEGMTDEDMDPKLYFLINPRGHRCLMELE